MSKVIDRIAANANEHSYDIKIEETRYTPEMSYSKGTYFGRIGQVEAIADVHLAKTAVIFTGFDLFYNASANTYMTTINEPMVFCNQKSTQILTVGNKSYNLKFYTKDQIIKILEDSSVKVNY